MQKMRLVLAGLLALASFGAGELRAEPPAASQRDRPAPASDARRWQQLRLGMSQLDVLRILGEPGKTTRYYAFTRWEYPDALGRRVNFDDRGRLMAWGSWAR